MWSWHSSVHPHHQGSRSIHHRATVAEDIRPCCKQTGWDRTSLYMEINWICLEGGWHRFILCFLFLFAHKKLTVQHWHGPVSCIEATVGYSFISHEHYSHVGPGRGQVRGQVGATISVKGLWGFPQILYCLFILWTTWSRHMKTVSPAQHSSCSSIRAVMDLHVVKFAHVLGLQTKVSEA